MPPKGAKHANSLTVVPIGLYSDGDASRWPKEGGIYTKIEPDLYLQKVADMWQKDLTGKQENGKYVLDKLPQGYALYDKPRQTDSKHRDKYLFGHPRGKFDSPAKFFPHFLHLMTKGETNSERACTCINCVTSKAVYKHPKPGEGHRLSKATKFTGPRDEEGTPDVIQLLIDKCAKERVIDQPIIERESMDWRANREVAPAFLDRTTDQRSCYPRRGEIVLFYREIDGDLRPCDGGSGYTVWKDDEDTGEPPLWEAGVVAETPKEKVTMEDLIMATAKNRPLAEHGYRIESYPDPNNPDNKDLSARYKYLPLHHIRPFVFWDEVLGNVPDDTRHETILYALTVAASFALIERYHIKGEWPNPVIYCRGVWVGWELILLKDVVRLMPEDGSEELTDVLSVSSIRLEFRNMDESVKAGLSVFLHGKSFTTNPDRALKGSEPLSTEELLKDFPYGMCKYVWYPLHDESEARRKVTIERVVGRCFEANGMDLWFNNQDLSFGHRGTIKARQISAVRDKRIDPITQTWFWGDYRAEQIDLKTFNGINVSRPNDERRPHIWRKVLHVMDGLAESPSEKDRPPSKGIALPDRSSQSPNAGKKKKPQIINLDTEEEDIISETANDKNESGKDTAGSDAEADAQIQRMLAGEGLSSDSSPEDEVMADAESLSKVGAGEEADSKVAPTAESGSMSNFSASASASSSSVSGSEAAAAPAAEAKATAKAETEAETEAESEQPSEEPSASDDDAERHKKRPRLMTSSSD